MKLKYVVINGKYLILFKVFNFALKAENEWIVFVSLERLFQAHTYSPVGKAFLS